MELNHDTIKIQLEELPEVIKANQLKLLKLESDKALLVDNQKRISSTHMAEITSETEIVAMASRKKFTNETMREAELSKRLERDSIYSNLRQMSDKLDMELSEIKIVLEYNYNIYKSVRSYIDFVKEMKQ